MTYFPTLSGSSIKLFDQTLAATAAAIDTTANFIPAGYDMLEVFILARSDTASVLDTLTLQFNGDTGANYDRQRLTGINVAASAANAAAGTGAIMSIAAASLTASHFATIRLTIPAYAQTSAFKIAEAQVCIADPAQTNARSETWSHVWRSTAAINQIKIAVPAGHNLIVGSRMTIYGRLS